MKNVFFVLILLALFFDGCSPTDERMRTIAKSNHALLLTDEQGNKYSATHLDGDTWTLVPVH